MGLEFRWSDPVVSGAHTINTVLGTDLVRFGAVGLSQSAKVGDPAISDIEVDDPSAVYDFNGLRQFEVRETSAPSNNTIIWSGHITGEKVTRGPSMRTTSARRWTLSLTDQNWSLGERILIDADANRPAETAGDRLRWLINSASNVDIFDYGHVTYPTTPMDANDYRLQTAKDVIADCSLITGYIFWCALNEAHARAELYFMASTSTAYASTLSISNDPAQVDSTTVFAPSEDAEFDRDPNRVAYGIAQAYANGFVYVRRDATGSAFAFQDQVGASANVKTATTATTIANRELLDNDEETIIVTCSVIVPAASVNAIRAGHSIGVTFTHFPNGFAFGVNCRVMSRSVLQEEDLGQDYYRLVLELTPTGAAAPEVSGSPITICNSFFEDTRRQATGTSTIAIVAGATYRFAISQPQHEPACHTSDLTIETGTGGTAHTFYQNGPYGPFGPGGSGPAVVDSGTFTAPAAPLAGSSGVFVFTATTDGYAAPNTPPFGDDCWTFDLWRVA